MRRKEFLGLGAQNCDCFSPQSVNLTEPEIEAKSTLESVEPPKVLPETNTVNISVPSSSDSNYEDNKISFADFGVNQAVVSALADKGIVHPFPIQALTLPVALKGDDVIGQAKTGTGKTIGFAIPVIEHILSPIDPEYKNFRGKNLPQALVVLPTRELAKQVAQDFQTASANLGIRIAQIYGGVAYEPQVKTLKAGADVVVGTPGRLIDLVKQKSLHLDFVRSLVLDEADEMLDLGFLPDVETLLSKLSTNRQTMIFSATMPGPVVAMARRYMRKPTHIRANDPKDDTLINKQITQLAYRTHPMNKIEMLSRLIQAENRGLTIVFTSTKRSAANICDELQIRGFSPAALHGNLGQGAREQALRAFRKEKVDILVATDVAARGIDVDNVTHVVNYECPDDSKTYVHRIGRTGRAGNKGVAVTFIDWDDMMRWKMISKELQLNLPEPVETYHTSPHFFSDLKIDPETTGRIPFSKQIRAGLSAEGLEDLGETGKQTGKRGARGNSRGKNAKNTKSQYDSPRPRRKHRYATDTAKTVQTETGQIGERKSDPNPANTKQKEQPRRRRVRRRSYGGNQR